jgi:hypothetical protein
MPTMSSSSRSGAGSFSLARKGTKRAPETYGFWTSSVLWCRFDPWLLGVVPTPVFSSDYLTVRLLSAAALWDKLASLLLARVSNKAIFFRANHRFDPFHYPSSVAGIYARRRAVPPNRRRVAPSIRLTKTKYILHHGTNKFHEKSTTKRIPKPWVLARLWLLSPRGERNPRLGGAELPQPSQKVEKKKTRGKKASGFYRKSQYDRRID